ncbi:MAG: RusA family crossover junction endodeoxyribonuclease [Peptostreptococcaceae bacterium]|nr:RusA family crossover junction endodeoxyribonuclease [Peptostreptococcaceae bacterium]
MYSLTIPGEPVAKSRPRIGKFGAYTPDKTKNYETLVREMFFAKYHQPMMEGEIRMRLEIYFPIPKSASRKTKTGMREGTIRPAKRPDLDNIIKSISDALNKVAYVDDSQIVEVQARKYYSDAPRVEIHLEEL